MQKIGFRMNYTVLGLSDLFNLPTRLYMIEGGKTSAFCRMLSPLLNVSTRTVKHNSQVAGFRKGPYFARKWTLAVYRILTAQMMHGRDQVG